MIKIIILKRTSTEYCPSKRRSASSRTRNWIFLNNLAIPSVSLLIWSARRPGVETTICGRLKWSIILKNKEADRRNYLHLKKIKWLLIKKYLIKSCAWATWSLPPTIIAILQLIGAPRATNCSAIWNANSRVGVNNKAKIP